MESPNQVADLIFSENPQCGNWILNRENTSSAGIDPIAEPAT